MRKRVTQKAIAAALKIHVSTVSKALKGDPAIAKGTVEAVQAKAKEMGFRPDPMLKALASYRRKGPLRSYRSTLGWILNHSRSTDMSLYPGYHEYFEGAKARAEALGYGLEAVWVDGVQVTLKNLPRILVARGIRAVVFAPQVRSGTVMAFPVEDFCTLTIGYSLNYPHMDIITNDHFSTMRELLERLRGKGYERIGCYLWKIDNERMGRRARSALLAYGQESAVSVKSYGQFSEKAFREWVRQGGFDAIVSRGVEQWQIVQTIHQASRRRIGFASYAVASEGSPFSGMSHRNYEIGVRAIEWLSSKLERGQFGPSEYPQRLLIAGGWLDNATA
jgi:DNA-binding LacI/PurR family transcriptional regulator